LGSQVRDFAQLAARNHAAARVTGLLQVRDFVVTGWAAIRTAIAVGVGT